MRHGATCPCAAQVRSADGFTGWSKPAPVTFNESGDFGTMAVFPWRNGAPIEVLSPPIMRCAAFPSRAPVACAGAARWVAGFEGTVSHACIATSDDGVHWAPLGSRGDHVGSGLASRLAAAAVCGIPGVAHLAKAERIQERVQKLRLWENISCGATMSSFLGRAADTYVQPLTQRIGYAQNPKGRVLYRRDFGSPGGWREIRGVQAR